jgi:hypothetical protein
MPRSINGRIKVMPIPRGGVVPAATWQESRVRVAYLSS